jgi:hypothetical protein
MMCQHCTAIAQLAAIRAFVAFVEERAILEEIAAIHYYQFSRQRELRRLGYERGARFAHRVRSQPSHEA